MVKKDRSVIYVHRAQVWKAAAGIDTEQKVTDPDLSFI
jgi:hypothetical protein